MQTDTNIEKYKKNGKPRDYTVSVVAEMFGVTRQYVAMIRDGKRNNEKILSSYLRIKEATKNVIQSEIESVQVK